MPSLSSPTPNKLTGVALIIFKSAPALATGSALTAITPMVVSAVAVAPSSSVTVKRKLKELGLSADKIVGAVKLATAVLALLILTVEPESCVHA